MVLSGSRVHRAVDVSNLLVVGMSRSPDSMAIACADERMTWRELDEASRRLASGFAELGLRPGDRLASLIPNGLSNAVVHLACLRAGLVTVPLNYRYTPTNIDHALEVCEAAALVAHAERADDVAACRHVSLLPLGLIGSGDGFGDVGLAELQATPPDDSHLCAADPHAPAAVFFTSGSTGPAKGVSHSLESLGWMMTTAVDAFELASDDVFLPASSLSHLGAILCMLSSLAVGASVVIARSLDAGEVLALLRAHRPTILAMVPSALTAVVRDPQAAAADFSSLRFCRVGADRVSPEFAQEFRRLTGFFISEGYGMTEAGIVSLNPPSGEIRPGSVGLVAPGVSVRLVDDHGADVPTGDVGRVLVQASSLMAGYWSDPDATAAVISDGWLDSGDLARVDEDGYLWFSGRAKDIIVHDGSNVSPAEVETALAEHPAVGQAIAVGRRDPIHGENVHAFVTLVVGAVRPSERELIAFARERVGYRAPETIDFLDAVPLNPTGKVDRAALKDMITER